ncbi:hypothetical protein ACFQ4X_06955 [Fictibacillus halophilus]|uniref:hypothetical protein n=1 Tax=Fictibacillus halophilus TaxID=1610490 RepID=UPI0036336CCB
MALKNVVDENGALIGKMVPVDKNYVIIHKKSLEGFKQKIEDRNTPNFIKCFTNEIKKLTHLTLTQCGYLLHILTFMNLDKEGYLIAEEQFLTQKKICEQLGIKGRARQSELFKTLITCGLIVKEGQKIKISEKYHAMGETTKKKFAKLHLESTRQLFKKLKHREVGMIYKLLPYVNRKYGVICSNPEEEEMGKIHFLSQDELAELVVEDERTISKSMKALDQASAALVIKAGKTDNFIIHPDFVMRMKWSHREALLTFFQLNEAKRKYARNRTCKK